MRIVIQRVKHASVEINGTIKSKIGQGLLILIGIEQTDTEEDVKWLVHKIEGLRIFDDSQGIMNLSVKDINGDALLVSQFTLMASYKKGNRPSWVFTLFLCTFSSFFYRCSYSNVTIKSFNYSKLWSVSFLAFTQTSPCG